MIQNVTSIQVAFVILVLARFEILDHCIYPSIRIIQVYPRCQRVFYFRDEAAIVSGKATHQSQSVCIRCKHLINANNFCRVYNLDRGYRSFATEKKKQTLQDPG